MFKEILWVDPQISNSDLSKMERNLNNRFGRVAKKFGKGMVNVLKGGGIAGAAISIVDKILNPLQETQESIDKFLKEADDLETNAKLFDTTAGKLFKLTRIAEATGLDQDGLAMLLNKFASAVTDAKADPKKDSAVRSFVGQTDMVEAFFEFIQRMQKNTPLERIAIQKDVFGEKQTLKAADFLGTPMSEILSQLKLRPTAEYDAMIANVGPNADLADLLKSQRTADDFSQKSGIGWEAIVRKRDELERDMISKENQRIQSYQDLANIQSVANKVLFFVEQGYTLLAKGVTKIGEIVEAFNKVSSNPLMRGILRGGKDK